MTMTLALALTNLRDRLNEPSEGVWLDPALRRYINEGMREVSRRSEGLRAVATIAVVIADDGEVAAPADTVRISPNVYWIPDGDTQRIPLEYCDLAYLDRIWGSRQDTTGTPDYWTTTGFGATLTIQLYPVPSTDGDLRVHYYRFAVELATDGTDDTELLDVPAGWEDTVVDYAAYRAYLAKHMTDMAQSALADFSTHLQGLIEATTRYTDSATAMIQDRQSSDWFGY